MNIKSLCEQIFKQVLKRLSDIANQGDLDYQLILINFVVQGCIRMFQQNIKIRVLNKDLLLIKAVQTDIIKSFNQFLQDQMGYSFQLKLNFLQNDCLEERMLNKQLSKNQEDRCAVGGVVLSDSTGNIVYKNTFDARVNILKQNALPLIRQMIWDRKKVL